MFSGESVAAGKTLIKECLNESAEAGQVGVQANLEHQLRWNQVQNSTALACGIPQAWYGAGLLSPWSKGRVGSIPTSRAISIFKKLLQALFVDG